MKNIKMTREQYKVSIPVFYDNLAELLGIRLKDGETYDCTKVCVAENIQESWFEYYREKDGSEDYQIAMLLCCYGPKADKDLPDDTVSFEDDWICVGVKDVF